MRFWSIEGNTFKLDGGAMFGNAPKVLWKTWMEPDSDNRITLSGRALLVEYDDGRRFLFECGIGNFFDDKHRLRYGIEPQENRLLSGLQSIGLSEQDIDAVVLSHLHFDHAGGLLTEDGKALLFPKATYHVGRVHFERAKNPSIREKASFIPQLIPLLEASSRLHLVDQAQFSHGHTEGLMISRVGPFVFVSDLIPGIPWLRTPLSMGYDRFSEKLVEEKTALLKQVEQNKEWVFFTHDPTCIACQVKQEGTHFVPTQTIDKDHLQICQVLTI